MDKDILFESIPSDKFVSRILGKLPVKQSNSRYRTTFFKFVIHSSTVTVEQFVEQLLYRQNGKSKVIKYFLCGKDYISGNIYGVIRFPAKQYQSSVSSYLLLDNSVYPQRGYYLQLKSFINTLSDVKEFGKYRSVTNHYHQ